LNAHFTNQSAWFRRYRFAKSQKRAVPDESRDFTTMDATILRIAALLGASAVALGAFGAHGLRDLVPLENLPWWETAARYHLFHALAALALSSIQLGRLSLRRWIGRLFLAGTVFFSGSLYAMTLGAPRVLGAVTPFGGAAWIAAWLMLLALIPRQPTANRPAPPEAR
jgi:uncharacterized membrane protein YgdD (TMEM256/DUF423 family)